MIIHELFLSGFMQAATSGVEKNGGRADVSKKLAGSESYLIPLDAPQS